MTKEQDKSSYLIIGVVIFLMGFGWLISSGGLSLASPQFQNWWAFGVLIPIFYLGQGAYLAQQQGRGTIGYLAGAFGSLAVLFGFLGLINWGLIGAVAMLGIGIGFMIDSRS